MIEFADVLAASIENLHSTVLVIPFIQETAIVFPASSHTLRAHPNRIGEARQSPRCWRV